MTPPEFSGSVRPNELNQLLAGLSNIASWVPGRLNGSGTHNRAGHPGARFHPRHPRLRDWSIRHLDPGATLDATPHTFAKIGDT